MANMEKQPERPRMDHILLEALTNRDAFGILQLANPAYLPSEIAAHVAVPMPYQEATGEALQGVTSDGDGVLHVAARLEDVELVRAISSRWRYAVDVGAKNKRGETALHCAAATGNVNMITLLIPLAGGIAKRGKLLREQNSNGETCLHDAVRCGKRDAVERLLGEDVMIPRIDGTAALVQINDKEGVSPLYLATTLRQLEIVQCLTAERGVYPAASYDGPGSKTAMHAAVLLSKDITVHLASWQKELIEKADVFGSTPLHLLGSTKDKFIMKLLLDMDGSVGYRSDEEGYLPIHVAATNGSLEIVKLFAESRPSSSWSCNVLGQTILHIAVQNGRYSVVDYICSGQNFTQIFNSRDTYGNTALHLAVLQGDQFTFCRLMRRREVCLSFTNKEERTPLDLAQLSIPPGISFLLKTHRRWIMYALVVAGADYGTHRSDHLARNVAKRDKEKESESISKSAGVLAVCAVLILTTAFVAPFSVTHFYDKMEKNIARRVAYAVFAMSDAWAFGFSVACIACFTRAGFSFTDRGKRLVYLSSGLACLFLATIFIILVFTGGVYLAVGPVVDTGVIGLACLPGVLLPLILLMLSAPASAVLVHVRALISRLGCPTWSSARICLLPRQQRGDRVPVRYNWLYVRGLLTVVIVVAICQCSFVVAILSAAKIDIKPT